jgi:hypothetical protein
MAESLKPHLVELIRHTSSGLGKDVIAALQRAATARSPAPGPEPRSS